jgi:ribonucleoside-diphosphate reductase alpha chain
MTKASLEQRKTDASEVELQPASIDIWDKKYRLKAKSGHVIDRTIDDTFKRVASALAAVDRPVKNKITGIKNFCGRLETAPSQQAESFLMRVLANTNQRPVRSTVPCLAPSLIQ